MSGTAKLPSRAFVNAYQVQLKRISDVAADRVRKEGDMRVLHVPALPACMFCPSMIRGCLATRAFYGQILGTG